MNAAFLHLRESAQTNQKGVVMGLEGPDYKETSTGLRQALDEYLHLEKSFLRHRYSLRDLSEETGIAMYQLSAFLNRENGMNFNDFINQYRVNYCLDFLKQSIIKKVNLSELSGKCGFNNRNTFTTSFKKVTGETPSSFIKKIYATHPV